MNLPTDVPAYYGTLAQQVLNAYKGAANSDSLYSQGFSDMLQHLASQESTNAMDILNQQGVPEGAQNQVAGQVGDSGASDVLYGTTGYIPASNLGQEGAAWAAYTNTLPGLLNQELAQNQSLYNMQAAAAAASRRSSSSGGGGGGSSGGEDSGGLTPAQQLAQEKFAYEQDQDAMKWDFEMAKWDHQLAMDKQEAKNEDAARKLLMAQLGYKIKGDKQNQRNKDRDYNLSVTRENRYARTDQARLEIAWARETRMASAPKKAGERGKNVAKYLNGIGSDIEETYTSRWPVGRTSGTSGSPVSSGGTGGGTNPKPNYGAAWGAIYSALKAKYSNANGKWQFGVKDKNIRKRINTYLAGQGVRPKNRRPPPRRPVRRRQPPRHVGQH